MAEREIEPKYPAVEPSDDRIITLKGALVRSSLLLVAAAIGIPAGYLFARSIERPRVESLYSYRPDVVTRVLDRDGRLINEYGLQRRVVVAEQEISPHLLNAIVAIEDSRFYQHGGVDPQSVLRAAIADVLEGRKAQGASTLTQQLAKQIFLTPEKSWRRKINEAFLAVEIEKTFTKKQILVMYANQVYLGHGTYGVESASRMYFGKHASDLNVAEAATIAAVLQRPEAFSPIRHGDTVKGRRNKVINQMASLGYIDEAERSRAVATPIVLGSWPEEIVDTGAYFGEEVRQELQEKYGTEGLYRKGLVVETTIDTGLQAATEKALQKQLRKLDKARGFRAPDRNLIDEGVDIENWTHPSWEDDPLPGSIYPGIVESAEANSLSIRFRGELVELDRTSWAWTRKRDLRDSLKRGDLIWISVEGEEGKTTYRFDQYPLIQGAVVVLDVPTGEVRALVGGYDFNESKFNRAIQSERQLGSAFKPFVYGAAFEQGYTPADTVFDKLTEFPLDGSRTYRPRNYTGTYIGIVTLQRAIEMSINVPAVKMALLIGVDKVIDFAKRSGFKTELEPYPSIALGAAGAPPIEIAAAYNSFANRGVYLEPRMIRRILDSDGKVLEETFPEVREATSEQIAYVLTHAMQAVVRRGTGFGAHTLPGVYAGKSGTTNAYTDAWFVGFSPEFTVAVWVGYDDARKSLGRRSTGGDTALPVWVDVFRAIDDQGLRGEPRDSFDVPSGISFAQFDLMTGRRAEGPCGRIVTGAFLSGTEPQRDCWGELPGFERPELGDAQPLEKLPEQPATELDPTVP